MTVASLVDDDPVAEPVSREELEGIVSVQRQAFLAEDGTNLFPRTADLGQSLGLTPVKLENGVMK